LTTAQPSHEITWEQVKKIAEQVQYGDIRIVRKAGLTVAVVPSPVLEAKDFEEAIDRSLNQSIFELTE